MGPGCPDRPWRAASVPESSAAREAGCAERLWSAARAHRLQLLPKVHPGDWLRPWAIGSAFKSPAHRASGRLAFAQLLGEHGGDQCIQTHTFEPGARRKSRMQAFRQSLNEASARTDTGTGERDFAARLSKRGDHRGQRLTPIGNGLFHRLAVRYADIEIGVGDQEAPPPSSSLKRRTSKG